MSFHVNGVNHGPTRYTPPPPPPVTELTARDVTTAARAGVQAVPVRNNDPVTAGAKSEKRGEMSDDRRAEDSYRLDRLRLMALKRDAAAITGSGS
jgi:hypothetical protein